MRSYSTCKVLNGDIQPILWSILSVLLHQHLILQRFQRGFQEMAVLYWNTTEIWYSLYDQSPLLDIYLTPAFLQVRL